jgi:hypothetical protein
MLQEEQAVRSLLKQNIHGYVIWLEKDSGRAALREQGAVDKRRIRHGKGECADLQRLLRKDTE